MLVPPWKRANVRSGPIRLALPLKKAESLAQQPAFADCASVRSRGWEWSVHRLLEQCFMVIIVERSVREGCVNVLSTAVKDCLRCQNPVKRSCGRTPHAACAVYS